MAEYKKTFDGRIVLSLLLYQDDFETNNPLGSQKGVKIGSVYTVVSCLPVTVVQEFQFLENEGILVNTSSGMMRVYFLLAGLIGGNLGIHTILGFLRNFSSNRNSNFRKS